MHSFASIILNLVWTELIEKLQKVVGIYIKLIQDMHDFLDSKVKQIFLYLHGWFYGIVLF